MKKYLFAFDYYPKGGGDDKCGEMAVNAPNLVEAKKAVEKWLKRRSSYYSYKFNGIELS